MEIVAGEQGLALKIFLIFLKFKPSKNLIILMPGASNLAVLMFSTAFSISGILKVAAHNFMKSRLRDGLAAKGLLVLILLFGWVEKWLKPFVWR